MTAIGHGTLTDAEVQPELTRLRAERDAVDAERDRARFGRRQLEAIAGERDELLAMAADFPALAAQLDGRDLRELLSPWIAAATVDPTRWRLTLGIRQVPAAGRFLQLSSSPGPPARRVGLSNEEDVPAARVEFMRVRGEGRAATSWSRCQQRSTARDRRATLMVAPSATGVAP